MVNTKIFIQIIETIFFKNVVHSHSLSFKIDKVCIDYFEKNNFGVYSDIYKNASKKFIALKYTIFAMISCNSNSRKRFKELDVPLEKVGVYRRLLSGVNNDDVVNQFLAFYFIMSIFGDSLNKRQKIADHKLKNKNSLNKNYFQKTEYKQTNAIIYFEKQDKQHQILPADQNTDSYRSSENCDRSNINKNCNKADLYKNGNSQDSNKYNYRPVLYKNKNADKPEKLKNQHANKNDTTKNLKHKTEPLNNTLISKIETSFIPKIGSILFYYLTIINKFLTTIDLHRIFMFRKGFDLSTLMFTDDNLYLIITKELKSTFGNKLTVSKIRNIVEKISPYESHSMIIKVFNIVNDSTTINILKHFHSLKLLKCGYIFLLVINSIIYGPVYYFQTGFSTLIKNIIEDEAFNRYVISLFITIFWKIITNSADEKVFLKKKLLELFSTVFDIFHKNLRKNFVKYNRIKFGIRSSKAFVRFVVNKFVKSNEAFQRDELKDLLYFIWIYNTRKCGNKNFDYEE